MSAVWVRTVLTAYRVAGVLVYPFVGPYVRYRTSRGKEDRKRRNERYGRASCERPQGPVIWVHAASVGETVAIIPLVRRLAGMGLNILLTTGTVTSARLIADHPLKGVIHQFVPFDLGPAVGHFLDHWQPDLAIMCESEIWPGMIMALAERRIPQVQVNARLSDRSFERWQKRPALAEALFSNFSHVIAQSDLDGERYAGLGARPVTVSGNLKVDSPPRPPEPSLLQEIKEQIGDRKRWAAISTHEGEEQLIAQVHKMLRVRHENLLTIIVPRHPHRADEIEQMLLAEGLSVARKSRGDAITHETAIYLGDTIGDMGLYLRLSEIAFVGKSLVGEGGHNPIEPAMLGTAVLSGNNVQNFRDAYQRLIKNGGARLVKDRDMLAGAVNFLLENPRHLKVMIAAGLRTVKDLRGSLDRTLTTLDPFIHPLILQSRLPGDTTSVAPAKRRKRKEHRP